MRFSLIFSHVCLVFIGLVPAFALADWPRFRGPNGSGIAADEAATPVEWSASKNVRWKVPLTGAGVSSPIVVAGRVLVTCYSGYGESRENPGSMDQLVRHLLCFDAQTGELLWQRDVSSEVTEDAYSGIGVPSHGYASHTPTSDGERVYVFFGKTGVLAFDLEGKQLWQTSVGTDSDHRRWGSASSPIVYEDVLVVPAGAESRAVVGLNKNTGEELWRAEADGLGSVWGTPAIVQSGSATDIVIGAPYEVWALHPETGKLTWYCEVMETDSFNSSLVVSDDKIYAIEGRGGGSIGLKAGGKDDVTKTNVIWQGRDNGRFGTPIVYQGRLYNIYSGIAYCLDANTGEEIFKGRLRGASGESAEDNDRQSGGPPPGAERGGGRGGFGRGGGRGMGGDYSSPVVADGKLYYVTASGDMYVLEAGREFRQLAVNRVHSEPETFSATPAISQGAIFLRSNKHLYCIAE